MRVLFLSQYFYPEQFSNNAIARELVRRGHEVRAVTCVPNYPAGEFFEGYDNKTRREEVWEGVHIHRARTVARGKSKRQLIANYIMYPIAAVYRIARTPARRADVSFVSMPSPLFQAFAGIFARWIWRIPTVYWVQDLWPETVQYLLNVKEGLPLSALDRLCGWLYRKADIVMVQSPAMVPLIERHGVDPSRIRVLHNTAPDLYLEQDPEIPQKISEMVPDSPFKLLFAGNIGESQGLDVLVDAAALIADRKDIHFVMVGSGRAMPALQKKIAAAGLDDQFTFCGRFPESDMPAFFASADALFLSLRDFPNFALTLPFKVQTYLAAGRPVVASIAGEGARVVADANAGFACPPEDPKSLADCIVRMADLGKEARAELGSNGREYFMQHFASDVIYDTLEKALTDAASTRKGKDV